MSSISLSTFLGVKQFIQLPWWYDILVGLVKSAIILSFAYGVILIYRSIVDRAVRPRLPAIADRTKFLGTWLIWLIAILTVLPTVGLETTILTYIFLLIGFATVLASKDLIANWVTQQIMETGPEFNVGDWILLDGYNGRVVEITPMNTIVMTADNRRVIIPNSFFSNHIVINQTAYGGICIDMHVTVDRKHDLAEVENELLKIGKGMGEAKVDGREPRVVIEEVGTEAVKIVLHVWTSNPARAESIRSDANRRIHALLKRLEVNR